MTKTITIEIGERSFAVPQFMLAELEQAAPHIDSMNELYPEFREAVKAGVALSLTKQFKLLRSMVEIIAVGTVTVDPEMNADAIMKSVNFSFMASIGEAVRELLKSSGLTPEGEAKAPSPRPASKGAKSSRRR